MTTLIISLAVLVMFIFTTEIVRTATKAFPKEGAVDRKLKVFTTYIVVFIVSPVYIGGLIYIATKWAIRYLRRLGKSSTN